MDTLRTIIDSKLGLTVGGAGSIWISFVEWLPFWLRIFILLGWGVTIWVKLVKEIRNK